MSETNKSTVSLSPRPIRITAAILGMIVIAIAFAQDLRFTFMPLADNLDWSWVATISQAQANGYRFGTDIAFTVGPLLTGMYKYFNNATPFLAEISGPLMFGALLFIVFYSFSTASLLGIVVVCATAMLATYITDTLFTFTAIIAFYACTRSMTGRAKTPVTMVTALIYALMMLIKFSSIALVAPLAVLLDIVAISRRRLPLMSVSVSVLMVALWILSGQPTSSLGDYFRSGFEVAKYYSEAMSINGPPLDLIGWLLLATAGTLIIAYGKFLNLRQGRPIVSEVAEFLVIAAAIFLSFKHGFVRHDGHSLVAWGSLCLILAMVYALDRFPFGLRGNAALLGLIAATVLASHVAASIMLPGLATPSQRIKTGINEWRHFASYVTNYSQWRADRNAEWQQAAAAIRQASPLPKLSGTVDMIPNRQAIAIAAGMNLTPRPTIQEHGTYSPFLIDKNRQFFSSDKAPQYLFMAPGSIDNRHPALAEGALWPLFMEKYEVQKMVGDMLLLHKRATPLPPLLSQPQPAHARFNEAFSLPTDDNALFVSLDIRKTLLGRLMSLALKPPPVLIDMTYADGSVATYRIIPSMVSEGFILSPTIQSAEEYWLLTAGERDSLRQPVSFTLHSGRLNFLARLAYDTDIGVTISTISLAQLRTLNENQTKITRPKNISAVTPYLKTTPPSLMLSSEGIFAHAPSTIALPTSGAASLELGFGMRDGSWQQSGKTDGVCFSVVASATSEKLFERCLDPLNQEADRGAQTATVALPADAGQIELKTACRDHCSWDWSYWSRVELIKAAQ